MRIIKSLNELEAFRRSLPKNEVLGLVPTMGALHDGHLTLVKKARQSSDQVMVSIFVNPLQFNDANDFEKYPKQTSEDICLLEKTGCNIVFIPDAEEIYPKKPLVSFRFGHLDSTMEGLHRPGHFNGVALVVSKLFNLIKPHLAFFGEKDLQQLRIIQCLVNDLGIPVTVVPCETIRETDGLAMSSRNKRLNPEQKKRAASVYHYLSSAKELLARKNHSEIEQEIQHLVAVEKRIRLEYFNIVDKNTLLPCTNTLQNKDVALCIAAFVDEIRLIDNIIVSS